MSGNAVQGELKKAFSLIKAGRKNEALNILRPILKAHRNNVQAWWLAANALENRTQRVKALEKVLELRPGHPQAEKLLEKLQTPVAPLPAAKPVAVKPVVDDPFVDIEDYDYGDPFADVDDDDGEPRDFGDDLLDDLESIANDSSLKAPERVLKFEQTPMYIQKKKRRADDDAYMYMFRLLAILVVLVIVVGGGVLVVGQFITQQEENLNSMLMGDFFDDFGYDWDYYEASLGTLQPGLAIEGEISELWGVDFWDFEGQEGETVTIHVWQIDDTYGPMFYLFDSDSYAIGYGETGYGYTDWTQVQVDFVLPSTGRYLIGVGTNGQNGRYGLAIYK